MILYCVAPKIIVKEDDTVIGIDEPIKIFTDQRQAYDYMKDKDPEVAKNLKIYTVEA